MMLVVYLVFMGILGAILGSFACCQARRLHAKEKGTKIASKWSICESCHKRLKWYENIPIFSWLFLKGRCKKCHKKIGLAEFFAELGSTIAFLMLGLKFWPSLSSPNSPLPFISLALLIITFTVLAICFIYDALWSCFPSFVLYILLALSTIFLILEYTSGIEIDIVSLLAGIGILPGIYYLLYFFSKERLVGSGDWLLCLSISLILHNFWLCFFVLFLSNFLAVLIQLPTTLISKKKSHQFPFGPFLIIAFLIVYLASEFLVKIGIII